MNFIHKKNKLFLKILFISILLSSCNNGSRPFVKHGEIIDSLNHVKVYYNDGFSNVSSGRNLGKNNYNIGLKYQCVEFVKRYYYEYYKHEMPNSYGNAKDFFNQKLEDGGVNSDRDLTQFENGSKSKPKVGDLVVFDGDLFNPYGHVAIISLVKKEEIEVIQQNTGTNSRATYPLLVENKKWVIDYKSILGWLRKI